VAGGGEPRARGVRDVDGVGGSGEHINVADNDELNGRCWFEVQEPVQECIHVARL